MTETWWTEPLFWIALATTLALACLAMWVWRLRQQSARRALAHERLRQRRAATARLAAIFEDEETIPGYLGL